MELNILLPLQLSRKEDKTFGMYRMKPKCYGKQAIYILRSAQKQQWKSLNIIQTNRPWRHLSLFTCRLWEPWQSFVFIAVSDEKSLNELDLCSSLIWRAEVTP